MGEQLGIDLKLTTYTARHTYANVLMNAGASALYASKKMGNSESTIKRYFGDFQHQVDKKYKEAVNAFKHLPTDVGT
jgi:site-specific recombinase XerD